MFGCWDNNLGSTPALLGPPVVSNALVVGSYGQPAYHSAEDLVACQAYVVKYRRVFGRDPVGIWCLPANDVPIGPPPPVVVDAPPRCDPGFVASNGNCVAMKPPQPPPVFQPPIVREPPPSPPSTSNIYRHWGWRRRRPPVKRPYVGKPKLAPLVELCPIRGYTSRVIPGANEYQNFRCTPGQPVVIDTGLQRAGAADAYARHPELGLGSLDDITIGNIVLPTWALLAGAGVLALMFLKKGRR